MSKFYVLAKTFLISVSTEETDLLVLPYNTFCIWVKMSL